MARIVVTGAAGFIGRPLSLALAAAGHDVLGLVRRPGPVLPGVALRAIGTIAAASNWRPYLAGAEIVIHLATRAHRAAAPSDPDEAAAAAALARATAAAGGRRLLHMSSLRAMGAASPPAAPFRASDPPRPADPYGEAKLAIERAVTAAAGESGLELTILRPPLVHGAEARGNFRALLRLVASARPLPFAGIDNRRSLISVGSLVDLVIAAALAPPGRAGIYLAHDGALSTPDLLRALAAGLGVQVRLFPLPQPLWAALRRFPALGPIAARLSLSLAAEDGPTRAAFGWAPRLAAEEALRATARIWRERP